ncbi:MAG: hypothetical protein WCA59_07435 [Candidatus Binataceae bacterium]
MRHAASHCESDGADRTHVRECSAYITPIVQKLDRVRDPVGAVEEVIQPMGGVGQERLGLNFVPPIFGDDPKDKRVNLYVVVGMDRACRDPELKQARPGKQILKFRFAGSDRCDDILRARNCLVERFQRRPNVFNFVYGASLNIHLCFSILKRCISVVFIPGFGRGDRLGE